MLQQHMIRVHKPPPPIQFASRKRRLGKLQSNRSRSIRNQDMCRRRHAVPLQLLHSFKRRVTFQRCPQPKVDGHARRIDAMHPDSIQARTDSGRVKSYFSKDTGFGDLLDGGEAGLGDLCYDEVILLRGLPLRESEYGREGKWK